MKLQISALVISIVLGSLIGSVISNPTFTKRQIALKSYNDFQISDGTAGNCQAAADKVFAVSGDLKAVTKTDLDNLNTMARAAVTSEEQFNTAIAAATGEKADELKAGKTCNKVLKLTGELQVLNVKQAQGDDVAAKIATEQKKLNENLKLDKENAGKKMISFI
ncbi:small secreted protein, partial [Phakopsora pachyrhizi]